jgi:HSP20 family protein
MALVYRDRNWIDWPRFAWHDQLHRMLDQTDAAWLRVEEFEDGDDLVVRAELPGIDPDNDVELTVGEGTVHIRAHREAKAEHKDKDGYRTEFRYGEFERDIAVPPTVTAKDVAASYKDGVLEVRITRTAPEPVTETKVPVTRS